MKLSTTNTFDVSSVAQTNSYQELQTFFDYINSFTSDVVTAFNKRISLADNLSFVTKALSIKHGESITLGKYSVAHLLIKSLIPISYYTLVANAEGNQVFTPYFKTVQPIKFKEATWIGGTTVRYLCTDISWVQLGDFVEVTGATTVSNNGIFQVVGKNSSSGYLYLTNYNRTDATDDLQLSSFTGENRVAQNITLGILT